MGRSTLTVLVLLCVTLYENVTIAEYLSSCKTPDEAEGTCVLVRECPFVRAVLKKQELSNNDIRYVEAIRCGTLETKALICCNEPNVTQTVEPVDAETIAGLVENRFSTREEKRELLPTVCGQNDYPGPLPGERAMLFHYAWNILVQHRTKEGDSRFHCGGALISDRYVLTAARCIMDIKKTWTVEYVRVGDWDLQAEPDCSAPAGASVECADPALDVPIEKITIHPNYTRAGSPEVKHDIALLRLARKIPTSSSVSPICLPLDSALRQEVNLESGLFVESGWGKTLDAPGSDFKMNFFSVGVSREECRSKYPHANIDASQICVTPQRIEDTCQADCGGPLMHRNVNGALYLMGIASIRKECANVGEPAVYTNVGEFVDWIVDNLEP